MPDKVLYEDQHFEVIYPGKTRPAPKVKPPPKQTETTEVTKLPTPKQPDVSEKELLPFPDSPITIILGKNERQRTGKLRMLTRASRGENGDDYYGKTYILKRGKYRRTMLGNFLYNI